MKIILALILSSCTMNKDTSFYQKVISDFDRYSYFISIEVHSEKYNGKCIIENDDLYSYLQQTQKIDKEKYKAMIKEKLINHSSFELGNAIQLQSNFIKVPEIESVDVNVKKGTDEFIKIYFDNGKVLKDGITDDVRTAVIQKLFEWEVASKIDDETGYLILNK